jgi:Na+/glutamate symporter
VSLLLPLFDRDFFARVHFTWSCGIGAGVTTAVLIARLTGVT